jgi:predicted aldo/keto reductase-like oxidoreductase
MKGNSSRRSFLAAGLAVPAAAWASASRPGPAEQKPKEPAGSGPLRYRVLGKTGMKVTSMGFGCMITSDQSVVEKAADLGINYFDTARGYQGGNNERMVGAALKSKRKNLYLSTKSHTRTKQGALDDLDASLKTLATDYVDIWYLHGVGSGSEVTDDLLEAQRIAKQAGKARFVGVSTHGGQPQVIPAVIAQKMDVVLAGYNFTLAPDVTKAVNQAAEAGLGVVAMKTMAGGFRKIRPGSKLYDQLKKEGTLVAALKWVLKNQNVHTTVPSITDMDQLDENMRAMTVPLSPDEEKLLAEQLDYIRPLYCRMCGRCNGVCPQGLPVADLLRFLSYAEGYGQYRLGRESFLELPAELRAVRCADCATCAVHCPNGVRVAERLIRAQELFA